MLPRVPLIASVALLSVSLTGAGVAALSSYSQDFESLNRASGTALEDDGYDLFVNVFDSTGVNYLYGYGVFPAPNNTASPNISIISDVPSGGQPPVGPGLVILSDYGNNAAHTNGERVEVNVFQEQTINVADIGSSHTFSFVAAPVLDEQGNNVLAGTATTALAFIKTIDPSNGFATTNFLTVDTTLLTAGNTALSLTIDLTDPLLAGQLLQFGFQNTASNFEASAVNYDNVSFAPVPEPASLALLALGGVAMLGRRRDAR